jgi:hypothetical protein
MIHDEAANIAGAWHLRVQGAPSVMGVRVTLGQRTLGQRHWGSGHWGSGRRRLVGVPLGGRHAELAPMLRSL